MFLTIVKIKRQFRRTAFNFNSRYIFRSIFSFILINENGSTTAILGLGSTLDQKLYKVAFESVISKDFLNTNKLLRNPVLQGKRYFNTGNFNPGQFIWNFLTLTFQQLFTKKLIDKVLALKVQGWPLGSKTLWLKCPTTLRFLEIVGSKNSNTTSKIV